MRKIRMILVAGLIAVALGSAAGSAAYAAEVETGDAGAESNQSAESGSGNAVGGQVTGVVSGGNTSIDASNHSEDVKLDTGDAKAENLSFTGAGQFINAGNLAPGTELKTGDAEASSSQSAVATSGDAIGGQVTGVVTPAGGNAELVLANHSESIKASTGDAESTNKSLTIAVIVVI